MINSNCTFSFIFETQEKSSKLMQNLNFNKTTQQYDISIKLLKENSEICSCMSHHNFSNSLFSKVSPNVTPLVKKVEKVLKNNYRSVNILPKVSKFYESCINDQINNYFHPLFFKIAMCMLKGI